MAMTPYSGDTSVIGKLGTTPQERGLTTQQFKDKFDEGLKAFVEWFNETHNGEINAHLADSAPHPEANFATKNYVQSNAMFIFPYTSPVADANLDLADGIYPVSDTLKNGPYAESAGENQGMLIVARWQFNRNFKIQIHVSIYNGSIYVRLRTQGGWTPWHTLMTTDKDQTMAAKLKAHNNTDYTTAQVRNIILSPDEADAGLMGEGDIWIKYE